MHHGPPPRRASTGTPRRARGLAALVAALAVVASAARGADPAVGVPPPPPPPVVFQAQGEAARAVAAACAALWAQRGAGLAAALLPAGADPDTVTCQVLGSRAFAARFSGRLPDWGVGVALWPGRLVAVDHERAPAVRGGPGEIFLHEMAHALLMQAGGAAALPAWLHEGAAMRLSGEWRWRDTASVILEGRLPSLDRLRGPFPAGQVAADQAYRASLLAVNFLAHDHGQDVVARIARAAADSADFRAGFAAATGEEVDAFEARFAAAMNLRFGWLLALARWPTLFVLMAALFVVGAIRRLARARRRLREMAEED